MGETFVTVSDTAPVLRGVIDQLPEAVRSQNHASSRGGPCHHGKFLIVSTRGVGLLPAYARHFLPSVCNESPSEGDTPTVDLVLGYSKSNQSLHPEASCFEQWTS